MILSRKKPHSSPIAYKTVDLTYHAPFLCKTIHSWNMVQQEIAVNKNNIQHINAQSLFNEKQDQTALLACLDFAFHKKRILEKKRHAVLVYEYHCQSYK